MTDWAWARFACGVWLQGENRAISPVEWGMCASEPEEPSGEVRLRLDLGWKIDSTAIVPHWMDGEGVAHLGVPEILVPPEEKGVALSKNTLSRGLAARQPMSSRAFRCRQLQSGGERAAAGAP
jgi:hypothetical protein